MLRFKQFITILEAKIDDYKDSVVISVLNMILMQNLQNLLKL